MCLQKTGEIIHVSCITLPTVEIFHRQLFKHIHVYSILFISLCKQSEADQPLLTRSMIQERLESKYAKYQQVVVRVQFPDKVVLQGLFRPKETGQ